MMPPRYLLDTNICIYIRRQQPREVLARFQKLRQGAAVISVITYGELLFGAEKSDNRVGALQLLEELTAFLPVLSLPREAANAYRSIRAKLQARGEAIGNNDLWIAAHAKAAALTLVTNNEKEFKRIAGLKVQNWAKPN
jgi:tRNA(fMet)-specific endonuclease VapC